MTQVEHQDPSVAVAPRPGLRADVLAAALAASGPVAMRLAHLQASLLLVLCLAAALTIVLRLLGPRGPAVRLGAIAAASVVLVPVTGLLVGLWFGLGATFGEWVLRGRPPSRHLRPLTVPAQVAMVGLGLPSLFLSNSLYRTIPFTVAVVLHLAVLQAAPATPTRRRALAAAAVAALAGAALLARPTFGATSSVLLVAVALGVALAAMAWCEPGAPWRWSERPGVLIAVVPAAIWSAINVGLVVDGARVVGGLGYTAWEVGRSLHAHDVEVALAATGVPSVLVGLLAIGVRVSIEGRSALALAARATGIVIAACAAVALCWTIVLPVG